MLKHIPFRRLTAMALSIVMVLTLAPFMLFAEEPHLGIIDEIVSFTSLDEEITTQAVILGASPDDVNLPDSLAVTVKVATGTDAQEEETEPNFTTEETIIPIIWDCFPAFDSTQTGVYIFTPVIENYAISAVPPQITVSVIEGIQTYSSSVAINMSHTSSVIQSLIQDAIDTANTGGTVTVTGSGTGGNINLNIPADITVRWQAEYDTIDANNAVELTGNGVFEVFDGGVLNNNLGTAIFVNAPSNVAINICGTGKVTAWSWANGDGAFAINTNGNVYVSDSAEVFSELYNAIRTSGLNSTVTVSGGTVSSASNIAIRANGLNSTVTVNGGLVYNTGAETTIYMSNTSATGENVIISGTGKVEARGNSAAIDTYGNVAVSGSAVVSALDGYTIWTRGENSTVTVSGGTVSSISNNAISSNGQSATVTVSGGTVSSISNNAISSNGQSATVTVSGGTVSSFSNNAIRSNGQSATVTVSGGTVSSFSNNTIYATGLDTVITVSGGLVYNESSSIAINFSDTSSTIFIESEHAINSTVNVSGTGRVEARGGSNAIHIAGSVSVSDSAFVSSSTGYAIWTRDENSTVNISGGVVFSHGDAVFGMNNAIMMADGAPAISGTAVVIAWDESTGNNTYQVDSTTDLDYEPSDAAVGWIGGGIAYENGTNIGIIPVDGITVTKITLTESDLIYTNPETLNHAYIGSAQGIGAIMLESPHDVNFNATTGGTFTVYYNGAATAPTGVGTYVVVLAISGGTKYESVSIPLGTYVIAKATTSGINQTFEVVTDKAHTYSYDLTMLLPDVAPRTLGNVTYNITSVANSDGVLAIEPISTMTSPLTVNVANVADIDKTATITITVSSDNYNDFTVILTVKTVTNQPVTIIANTTDSVVENKQLNLPKKSTTTATGTVTDNHLLYTITKPMVENSLNRAWQSPYDIALIFRITRNDITGQTIQFTADAIDLLASSKLEYVQVETSIFKFSFDTAALTEINKQTTGTVTVNITPTTISNDNRPAYDITINDNTGKSVTNLGSGEMMRSIAYTPAASESTGNLYIHKLVNDRWETISNSSYNNGFIIWSGNTCSVYGVAYKTTAHAFTDTINHWAAENINFVTSRGIMAGTSETTFEPNTVITRGMFITMLGRIAETDVSGYTTSRFNDVPKDSYYAPYVEWAVDNKIVSGIDNNRFDPNNTITREDIAVMMVNYAKALNYDLPIALQVFNFTDSASISSYATGAVTSVQQAGIIVGKEDGRFDPKGNLTRAEAATIVRRFAKLIIDSTTTRGWVQNESGRWMYYSQSTGNALTGWQTIDGSRYYFNHNGIMRTGWLNFAGKRYYFHASGKMISGRWVEIDNKHYYFYPDGTLAANTIIDGYWLGS
jgi:FOG: Glucan-binding domain (YG repeat)